MSKKYLFIILFIPILFSFVENDDKLTIQLLPTLPYSSDLDFDYRGYFYNDSYSYLRPKYLFYEISIINNSEVTKYYWIMTGLWADNWTVSNDSFKILDPYCCGSQNFRTREFIKPHGIKKYKITIKGDGMVSSEGIKNLKVGFYYFDATNKNSEDEFEEWRSLYRMNPLEIEEEQKAIRSKIIGDYEYWLNSFLLSRYPKVEMWKKKKVIWQN
jgi:hypothetical protein